MNKANTLINTCDELQFDLIIPKKFKKIIPVDDRDEAEDIVNRLFRGKISFVRDDKRSRRVIFSGRGGVRAVFSPIAGQLMIV